MYRDPFIGYTSGLRSTVIFHKNGSLRVPNAGNAACYHRDADDDSVRVYEHPQPSTMQLYGYPQTILRIFFPLLL